MPSPFHWGRELLQYLRPQQQQCYILIAELLDDGKAFMEGSARPQLARCVYHAVLPGIRTLQSQG